jgi:putative tryptophan/tyrosine transport system substrate-binding protein
MKKIVVMIIGAALGALLLWQNNAPRGEKRKIGIVQTVSHSALNEAKEGFISAIKGSGIEVVVQNAEGSLAQARSIVQAYHADPAIQGIYAIGTPAAQTAVSIEKKKPIIFAAVTDPQHAGILQENSCGASDLIDAQALVAMLKELLPQANKIAIPFNPSEVNSVGSVKLLKEELKKQGLESLEVGISQESEISAAITKASLEADVFVIPTDNLMASAMPLIVKTAAKQKKAVISSFNSAVAEGAIAARGADYFALGKKAGEMALTVLEKGSIPKDLPIYTAKESQILFHAKTCADLGINIPASWKGGNDASTR